MTTDTLTDIVRSSTNVAAALGRPEINRRARLVLVDSLGVIWGGGRRPGAAALVDGDSFTGSWRYPEPSTFTASTLLVEGGGWASADRAAFVHASVACDLELDEGMRPTGHPAIHILPAVLAAAETLNCDLDEVLGALVVGYEVAGLLFQSFQLRPGVHPHGHLGAIASASAVAYLRGVDPAPAARVAASLPLLTTWAPCLDGATIRNTWAGHAASVGVLAHRYADAGWSGSTGTLETAFNGIVADRIGAPVADAQHPQLLNSYFKLNSACALTHAAIEAARSLAPLDYQAVRRIDVLTTNNNMKIAPQAADNALSRRFSIPFAVATALVNGSAAPAQFDQPDAESLELARLVSVEHDPEATAAWPQAAPATVTVYLNDDNKITARCENAPGTPGNPATEPQLRDKFATLTGRPPELWTALMDADGATKASTFLQQLTAR